jgi:branched-chain amino acid transport system substrate-binding protein
LLLTRLQRWFALLLATAVAVAVVPGNVKAADPYDINVILPLTGPFSFVGKGSQAGLLGVESVVNKRGGINGEPVRFVFHDDQSNPQTTVQIASGLIAQKVPLILGTASVAGCAATAPLVRNGPVMYCLSPGLHPAAGSWAFSANVASDDTMAIGIRYFNLRGIHRLAMIAATDASGQDQERGIDAALALPVNRDMTVVDREHFSPGDVSVAAQVARIKAADPAGLLALSTGAAVATVLRAVHDAGLDVPVFTTNGNSTYAQMKQYAPFLPKDLYFPDQPPLAMGAITDPGVRSQIELFLQTMKSLGMKPDGIPSTTWDPGMLAVAALKKFGTGMTADQFKDFLENLQGWPGAMGRYNFREVPQRGLSVQSVIIARWDAQKDWWVAVSKPAGAPL